MPAARASSSPAATRPPAVQALAGERVLVTGAVADMRTWLAAADVVVAPLRIARGIQNKVLEAMAMARPVVASPAAFEGHRGRAGPRPARRRRRRGDGGGDPRPARRPRDARGAGRGGAARRWSDAYRWEARLAPLAAMRLSRRGPGGGMTASLAIARRKPRAAVAPGARISSRSAWPAAAILLLFLRDAADMAAIWWNSSTFNHCLLIPPIIAWLVWQRLPELRRLDARRLGAGPRCWSAPARSAGCSARPAASPSPAMPAWS